MISSLQVGPEPRSIFHCSDSEDEAKTRWSLGYIEADFERQGVTHDVHCDIQEQGKSIQVQLG